MARPFPRVGRSIPRATGGPDEWLLLPLPGRGDRIRLTDLLRRAARRVRTLAGSPSGKVAKTYLDSATARVYTAPCCGARWGWWWSLGSCGKALLQVGCSEATSNMRSMTRVGSPSRSSYREALSGLQDERLVATKFRIGAHRCLDVYPFSAWRRLEEQPPRQEPLRSAATSRFRNVYVSGAHELAIDAQGRVLIPPLAPRIRRASRATS